MSHLERIALAMPTAPIAPAERWAVSDAALVGRLRDAIRADGPMRFDRYMATVLTDPTGGYYQRDATRPTRQGDFLSAPELHPIFGATLAAEVDEVWDRLGRPATFTLLDEGAGSGALGLAILDRLVEEASGAADAIRYLPLEVSPAREAAVRQRLSEAGHARRLADEAPSAGVTGLVVANELLDALPVRRVTVRGGRLLELHVDWQSDWFVEVALEPPSDELDRAIAERGASLVEGQTTELGLAAEAWVAGLADRLDRGVALVIDYGLPAPERYDPVRRPNGLLRTYHEHHVGDDPYHFVGRQDLTAHVDWTALERVARGAGLDVLGRTSQAEALAGLGIGDRLVELQTRPGLTTEDYVSARAAVARLLDPQALGGFGVLVLARGLAAEPPLASLAYRLPRRPS